MEWVCGPARAEKQAFPFTAADLGFMFVVHPSTLHVDEF
jgi:hypothetical protein